MNIAVRGVQKYRPGTRAELDGPSKTIHVEPVEAPDPRTLPMPEPEPERTPEPVREPEKVPA